MCIPFEFPSGRGIFANMPEYVPNVDVVARRRHFGPYCYELVLQDDRQCVPGIERFCVGTEQHIFASCKLANQVNIEM